MLKVADGPRSSIPWSPWSSRISMRLSSFPLIDMSWPSFARISARVFCNAVKFSQSSDSELKYHRNAENDPRNTYADSVAYTYWETERNWALMQCLCHPLSNKRDNIKNNVTTQLYPSPSGHKNHPTVTWRDDLQTLPCRSVLPRCGEWLVGLCFKSKHIETETYRPYNVHTTYTWLYHIQDHTIVY